MRSAMLTTRMRTGTFGDTAAAAGELVRKSGATVGAYLFVVELLALRGREKLRGADLDGSMAEASEKVQKCFQLPEASRTGCVQKVQKEVEASAEVMRKKIDKLGPPLIHTIRGVGYTLRTPPEG